MATGISQTRAFQQLTARTGTAPERGFLLLAALLLACGGRTPLGGRASASGSTSGTGTAGTNPPWVPPAADGSCPDGTSPCGVGAGTRCYALDRDPTNCGRCDQACTPGIVCAEGACQQKPCTGALSFAPGGTSAQSTPVSPRGLTIDMNGDGKLDLVEWSNGGALRIWLGSGDGTLGLASSYPAWQAAGEGYGMERFVVAGDFNEDGNPDLAISVPGHNDEVEIWLGNGDGTLQPRSPHTGQPASQLTVGDANRDGHLDIVVSNLEAGTLVVHLGRGDGRFRKAGTYPTENSSDVLLRDFDGDGLPDLAAIGWSLSVLWGTGDGRFTKAQDCGVALGPWTSVIADFDQDGRQDVANALFNTKAVTVLLGKGRCNFGARDDYATPGLPYRLTSGDVDGDGILDLVEVDSVPPNGHMLVLLGKGDGTFVPSVEWTNAAWSGDILLGDFDGDGRADILVSGAQGIHVETNTCP